MAPLRGEPAFRLRLYDYKKSKEEKSEVYLDFLKESFIQLNWGRGAVFVAQATLFASYLIGVGVLSNHMIEDVRIFSDQVNGNHEGRTPFTLTAFSLAATVSLFFCGFDAFFVTRGAKNK